MTEGGQSTIKPIVLRCFSPNLTGKGGVIDSSDELSVSISAIDLSSTN
jgi:hypothetical protein